MMCISSSQKKKKEKHQMSHPSERQELRASTTSTARAPGVSWPPTFLGHPGHPVVLLMDLWICERSRASLEVLKIFKNCWAKQRLWLGNLGVVCLLLRYFQNTFGVWNSDIFFLENVSDLPQYITEKTGKPSPKQNKTFKQPHPPKCQGLWFVHL